MKSGARADAEALLDDTGLGELVELRRQGASDLGRCVRRDLREEFVDSILEPWRLGVRRHPDLRDAYAGAGAGYRYEIRGVTAQILAALDAVKFNNQ